MSTRYETLHPRVSGYTDRSGSTTGSTSIEIMPENERRMGLIFQNISDTDMYLNVGAAADAAAGSILVEAGGGYWQTPANGMPTAAINVYCSAGSKPFTAKEW